MLSHIFLGMSLVGAEWVLYLLIFLSVVSISIIFERVLFYRQASKGLSEFREHFRSAAIQGNWEDAKKKAETRAKTDGLQLDLETKMALQLLQHAQSGQNAGKRPSAEVLGELAKDAVVRSRLGWEKNLSVLATIGNIAPFVGLFGTVLGIIKAFHDLSQQAATGNAQTVTAGISEALVATAIGILVAIPAVVSFNLFQRRVKSALAEAEALKSFLIGKLAE